MDTLFALDMGDGAGMLIAEIALSIAIIVAIMFVVRAANARSGRPVTGDTRTKDLDRSTINTSVSGADTVQTATGREPGEPTSTQSIRG